MKRIRKLCIGAVFTLAAACCAGCVGKSDKTVENVTEVSTTKSLSDQINAALNESDGSIMATEWVTKDHTGESKPYGNISETEAPGNSGSSGSSGSSGNTGSSGSSGNQGSSGQDVTAAPPQTEAPVENATASAEECSKALADAKQYVADIENEDGDVIVRGWSWNFVVRHLKALGYSETAARYGADNCGADWFAQAVGAVEKEKNRAWSRQELIDFLCKDEKSYLFTQEQAVYGVDHAEIDWNNQARKAAGLHHREDPNMIRSEVIEYLIYDCGFTSEQAEAGYAGYK